MANTQKPVKREYWIQIEGGEDITWNMTPNRRDRMHGKDIDDTIVKNVLILRRYKPPKEPDQSDAWTVPDDRKVNPWDLNEPNPDVTGGTIPGPVLECNVGELNVGEDIIVHFRNADNRDVPRAYKIHSLHPHGITFPTKYGGAYPLSPPDIRDPDISNFDEDDPNNEITDDERKAWEAIGVEGDYKQGDRVPPGGTFTYRWRTFGWPSTAGVWFYHDHSVKDANNVRAGAIGILVIHNPDDPDDVFIDWDNDDDKVREEAISNLPDGKPNGEITKVEVTIDQDGNEIKKKRLRKPPGKALYLQLYHELVETDEKGQQNMVGMAINGRKFLGNTPTLVGGYGTKMRFGLVAMNQHAFHTFHLHGHRWIIPGPKGNNRKKIQNSPQIEAASQFEDTRIFGSANSFSFTIKQGSFMGPLQGYAVGEWYMHCHVLHHMMPGGMIGSLLIIGNDEPEVDKKLLPEGHMFNE